MRPILPISFALLMLNGCFYAETPYGRTAILDVDLPTQQHTTIQKTVTVNAPAGTTVILQETPPPVIIREPVRRMRNYRY